MRYIYVQGNLCSSFRSNHWQGMGNCGRSIALATIILSKPAVLSTTCEDIKAMGVASVINNHYKV